MRVGVATGGQDAGDAGDAKTTSLTSGCNPCASDTQFIFADESDDPGGA